MEHLRRNPCIGYVVKMCRAPRASLFAFVPVHSITSGDSLGNWNDPFDFSLVAVGNDKTTEYVPVWSSKGGASVMSKFMAGVDSHRGVGDSGKMLTYIKILPFPGGLS